MRTNWDDHRYFLAIARESSLTAAGKALGVSQPTISRRLKAMEAKLKVRLFDRTPQGYELTAIGMDLFDTVQRVEEYLAEADRNIYGKDQDLTGGLRITCTEILLNGYLSPFVWQFLSQNPGIELSVVCTDSQLSLSRSDADLAIRFTQRPTETLAGRRLASVAYGVYTASGTAGDRFPSSNRAEWDWIGVHDEMHNRILFGAVFPEGRFKHRVERGVGLVWKIEVIDLVRFWCRDGRPKTAIRDNGPLQGRILSRRQCRAGEGGNAPHRQKRYDAVS